MYPERSLPLHAFPMIATRSVDELEEAVRRYYGDIKLSLSGGGNGFHGISNHFQFQDLGLTYASNGAALHIDFARFDYFGQLFAYRGAAFARSAKVEIAGDSTFVASADDPLTLDYAPDFEQVVLKFGSGALIRRFEAMIGDHVVGGLRFSQSTSLQHPDQQHLWRTLCFLLERIDAGASSLHPLALTELEQLIMVLFLTANRHNHSDRLIEQPTAIAPWQVRCVEEHIEANWERPVTIEMLTKISGTSARSIFHTFKKYRGYSPMEFVKHVRLQHARRLLTHPDSDTTVTSVGFACGFGNLSHFASHYQRKFGERPSTTLKRQKG